MPPDSTRIATVTILYPRRRIVNQTVISLGIWLLILLLPYFFASTLYIFVHTYGGSKNGPTDETILKVLLLMLLCIFVGFLPETPGRQCGRLTQSQSICFGFLSYAIGEECFGFRHLCYCGLLSMAIGHCFLIHTYHWIPTTSLGLLLYLTRVPVVIIAAIALTWPWCPCIFASYYIFVLISLLIRVCIGVTHNWILPRIAAFFSMICFIFTDIVLTSHIDNITSPLINYKLTETLKKKVMVIRCLAYIGFGLSALDSYKRRRR